MREFLNWIIGRGRLNGGLQILLGLALALTGAILRFPVEPLLHGTVPYITFFPVVLAASLLGGRVAGLTSLMASAVVSAYFFVPPAMSFKIGSQGGFGFAVFLVSGGMVLLCATWLRRALTELGALERKERLAAAELRRNVDEQRELNRRLAEQTAELARAQDSLKAIFAASSEGLTLCRLIRDASGNAVDYQVLDVNPAHCDLTSASREQMLATPVSEIAPPIDPRWIESAAAAVKSRRPQTFEVYSRATNRWLDIHVSPVSGDLFAQTFIDVTARREYDEQRSRLVAEMNHRVKNNFQMVSGILQQQARRIAPPEVRDQLHATAHRVHVLAELHNSLASTPNIGEVDFQAYLVAVCDRLRSSIEDAERVRLRIEAEPATLDASYAVPLGFVVNELVTNAIKYAYPPPAAGVIDIAFARDDDAYVLRIADSGIGPPPASDTKKGGIGMQLVKAFVAQIGATLDARQSSGVAYTIRLQPGQKDGV